MYNLRYHMASLVSVFIALALGLVLGGLIVDDSSRSSNEAMVESLRTEFETVREQSAVIQAQNERMTAFTDEVLSDLIDDQLTGHSVIVIRSDAKAADPVEDVIKRAGATPIPVTIDRAAVASALETGELSKLKTAYEKTQTDEDGTVFIEEVALAVVHEWADGRTTARPYTDALIKDGVLQVSEVDWRKVHVLGIVDVRTLDQEEQSSLPLLIVSQMIGLDFPGIITREESEQQVSLDTVYPEGASVIDALDSSIGQYTLVALLKGAQPGWYGTFSEAVAPFVRMPEELSYAGRAIEEARLIEEARAKSDEDAEAGDDATDPVDVEALDPAE